jgi:mono/diheme cytochrome c family protein
VGEQAKLQGELPGCQPRAKKPRQSGAPKKRLELNDRMSGRNGLRAPYALFQALGADFSCFHSRARARNSREALAQPSQEPQNMRKPIVYSLVCCALILGACKKEEAAPAAAPAPAVKAPEPAPAAAAPSAADDAAAAKEVFATRCTPCHGAQGAGDGAASAGLTPKPRNFTDPEWQKGVTDEHIEKIVVYGGSAVGKSPAMPPNPDLDAKQGVVKALRAHIRSLKK